MYPPSTATSLHNRLAGASQSTSMDGPMPDVLPTLLNVRSLKQVLMNGCERTRWCRTDAQSFGTQRVEGGATEDLDSLDSACLTRTEFSYSMPRDVKCATHAKCRMNASDRPGPPKIGNRWDFREGKVTEKFLEGFSGKDSNREILQRIFGKEKTERFFEGFSGRKVTESFFEGFSTSERQLTSSFVSDVRVSACARLRVCVSACVAVPASTSAGTQTHRARGAASLLEAARPSLSSEETERASAGCMRDEDRARARWHASVRGRARARSDAECECVSAPVCEEMGCADLARRSAHASELVCASMRALARIHVHVKRKERERYARVLPRENARVCVRVCGLKRACACDCVRACAIACAIAIAIATHVERVLVDLVSLNREAAAI
eukprot:6179134-Pleurochrysis_carterae.AAC.2